LSGLVVLAALAAPATASAAPAAAAAAAPAGSIVAVDCTGPQTCVGLGQYTPARSSEYYLQTWNGTAWGAVTAPLPGSEGYQLDALSCASARSCVAVGNSSPVHTIAPLAAAWNGTKWSVSKPPEPAGSVGGSFLIGVSCPSAAFCVAAGQAQRQRDETEGFADAWNGHKWTITRQLRTTDSSLGGVSCVSPRSCVAVGWSHKPDVLVSEYVKSAVADTELWNGRKWTQVRAPATRGAHAQLQDVSCWSARGCMATGFSYHGKFNAMIPLADSWNGRKWTAARPPAAGHAPGLYEVSCASAKSCLAVGVGNGNAAEAPIRAVADYWSGHAWKAVAAPVPSHGTGKHQGDAFDYVGCAAPSDCLALGFAGPYQGAFGDFVYPFAEHWNGRGLKLIPAS
jgi:hypothetical protein